MTTREVIKLGETGNAIYFFLNLATFSIILRSVSRLMQSKIQTCLLYSVISAMHHTDKSVLSYFKQTFVKVISFSLKMKICFSLEDHHYSLNDLTFFAHVVPPLHINGTKFVDSENTTFKEKLSTFSFYWCREGTACVLPPWPRFVSDLETEVISSIRKRIPLLADVSKRQRKCNSMASCG